MWSAEGTRRRADLFAALGDPTRLSLLAGLAERGPASVSALSSGAGLTRQGISKHLRVLERVGLVQGARVGRESRYACTREGLDEARRYLDEVSARWDEALARLRLLVEEPDPELDARRSRPASPVQPTLDDRRRKGRTRR